jgi:hypothetical protein
MRSSPIGDGVRWVRDFEALTIRTLESTGAVGREVMSRQIEQATGV